MSEIGVAGNLNEVLPFKAVGFEIYPIDEMVKEEALNIIVKDILLKKGLKILFITEEYYDEFSEFYEAQKFLYRDELPVITPITNGVDFQDIGLKRVKGLIEKAIGVDIFSSKE